MIAKELDPGVVDKVIVHVKNDTGYARTTRPRLLELPYDANTNGLKRHEWRHLVIVRATGRSSYWVDTLAHEFKHVEAYKLGHYRHLRKTRNSERRCRAFGPACGRSGNDDGGGRVSSGSTGEHSEGRGGYPRPFV